MPEDFKKLHKRLVPGSMVPKAFLKPLGYLTVWASEMEKEIDNAIIRFFVVDDVNKGWVLTADRHTLGNKMNFLRAIGELVILNPRAKKDFQRICADADAVIGDRNKLVHGRWMGSSYDHIGHSAMKVTYKAQGKLTIQQYNCTPKTVMATAELALGVSDQLEDFFAKYPKRKWNVPPTSRKKRPARSPP